MTASLLAVVLALSLGQSPPAADLEREARAIDATLVAPCCFRQEVSVHQSAAADEVRRDIRARLAAGQTREQIRDAYVSRYGKHILAEPPAVGFDLVLYVMPFVMLIASLGLVTAVLRRFTRSSFPTVPASTSDGPAVGAELSLEGRLDDELRDLD
jgi:cytochrome c-type biogenesis protein CcmH